MAPSSAPDLRPTPAGIRTLVFDVLGLDPRQTMMVAAHPWDLRAAEEHGMRSAYVGRPGEAVLAADDRFDVHARDLADLANLLAPPGGLR